MVSKGYENSEISSDKSGEEISQELEVPVETGEDTEETKTLDRLASDPEDELATKGDFLESETLERSFTALVDDTAAISQVEIAESKSISVTDASKETLVDPADQLSFDILDESILDGGSADFQTAEAEAVKEPYPINMDVLTASMDETPSVEMAIAPPDQMPPEVTEDSGNELLEKSAPVEEVGSEKSVSGTQAELDIDLEKPDTTIASELEADPTVNGLVAEAETIAEGRITEETGLLEASEDINQIVLQVIRESYFENVEDLQDAAEKVKYFNDIKKAVREQTQDLRDAITEVEGSSTPMPVEEAEMDIVESENRTIADQPFVSLGESEDPNQSEEESQISDELASESLEPEQINTIERILMDAIEKVEIEVTSESDPDQNESTDEGGSDSGEETGDNNKVSDPESDELFTSLTKVIKTIKDLSEAAKRNML